MTLTYECDPGTLMSLCLIVVFRIVVMLSLPLLFIGTLYSCIWVLQIYRSARRARSSGLSAEYLIGTTLGRLFFACCECSHVSLVAYCIHGPHG